MSGKFEREKMKIPEFSTGITVFLSTGKFSPDDILQKTNIPICVVQMGLEMFGGVKISLNKSEQYRMVDTLKGMAEIVDVNEINRTVIIRDNRPNGILVSYDADPVGKNAYHDEFFIKWRELRILLFEFQVYSDLKTLRPLFACKGLYDLNHWSKFDFQSTPTLILEDPKPKIILPKGSHDPIVGGGSLGG